MSAGVFYLNKNGEDLLLLTFKNSKVHSNKKMDNVVFLYDELDNIIGINIWNASKIIDLKNPGIYKFTKKLKDSISKINQDLNFIKDIEMQKGIVISYVRECEPIIGTHLNKCLVFDGSDEYQVICGASNIRKDIKVIFIKESSYLPDGTLISKNKISGVESNGMICSLKELGLEEKSEGIHIVEDDTPVGKEFKIIYKNGEENE